MTPRDQAKMMQLELAMEQLRRETRLIPLRTAATRVQATLLRVGRGNTIATGSIATVYGLGYSASSITAILAAELNVDAPKVTAADGTYTTGLTWAYTTGGSLVFLANIATPDGGTAAQDIVTPLTIPEGAQVWAYRSVAVPKDADPTVTVPVYLTWQA